MKILHKYITGQACITLFFTLAVFSFVLLFAQLLRRMTDMLINQQAGLAAVGWSVVLLLPYVLSFSLPMAMLATTLLVFGRLSADNELTAMRASGIGLGQVIAPVVLLAVVLSGLCLVINLQIAPQCRFAFKTLFLRMGIERPMALLEEGVLIREFPGHQIHIGRKDERAGLIENVSVWVLDEKGDVISNLHAQKGYVTPMPNAQKLFIDLRHVHGDLRDPKDPTNIHKIRPGTSAERYPIELDLGQALRRAQSSKRIGEMMFGELRDQMRELRARGIYPASELMEAHQRVAMAFACVAFALIGIPLGIKTSRRETTVGIALSLGLAVLYYFITVFANTLRNKPYLYPEAILWSPNLLFQLIGLWLLWRVTRA
jgi:lipopolysaccharide export system permease protein